MSSLQNSFLFKFLVGTWGTLGERLIDVEYNIW